MARSTLGGSDPAYDPTTAPDYPPPERKRGSGSLAALFALLFVAALIWALIATFDSEASAGPETGITLSELASDPEELTGSRVVVSAEISDIVGDDEGEAETITAATRTPTGFVIGEDDQRVLVVGANMPQLAVLRGNEDIAQGDVVQVSGTVRDFQIAEIEDELGADLADEQFEEFEDRPAIVASDVNLVPTTARQRGELAQLPAGALIDNPEEFLGQRVTVRDVTVDAADDVLSPRAFALGDDILVVGGSGPTGVQAGFRGSVTGTLIEASTARLLTQVNVPNPDELFAELGIEESELDEYDYAIVANSVTPG